MDRLPLSVTVKSTFGDDHVYMWIPFKVTAKSMKSTDHTGFEFAGVILFVKPIGDSLRSRAEKHIKKAAVFPEIPTEFFRDGKNDMTMMTVEKF